LYYRISIEVVYSIRDVPIVWLCGETVITGGVAIVMAAAVELALPLTFDTRTQ
jgi:hypothetical protein